MCAASTGATASAPSPNRCRCCARSSIGRRAEQEGRTTMTFPQVFSADEVARHFCRTLQEARRDDYPYRHWLFENVLPESLCVGILVLPIAPPVIDDCHGVRDRYNDKRCFFTPLLQSRFEACAVFAAAMQRPDVARLLEETCGK